MKHLKKYRQRPVEEMQFYAVVYLDGVLSACDKLWIASKQEVSELCLRVRMEFAHGDYESIIVDLFHHAGERGDRILNAKIRGR